MFNKLIPTGIDYQLDYNMFRWGGWKFENIKNLCWLLWQEVIPTDGICGKMVKQKQNYNNFYIIQIFFNIIFK